MNLNQFYQNFKIVTLTFFLTFFVTNIMLGQGWSSAYGLIIGSSFPDSFPDYSRADAVELTPFTDGISLSAFRYTADWDFEIAGYSAIENEEKARFSGIIHIPQAYSDNNKFSHIPKSIEIAGTDTTFLLFDAFNDSPGGQDLRVACYSNAVNGFGNLRLDSILWTQSTLENSDSPVYGNSIRKTLDNHLIVLGTIQNEIEDNQLILKKIGFDGNLVWSKVFETMTNEVGVQVIPAADGGFWVLKNVNALINPETSMWLMKTDSNGEIEWESNLSNEAGDVAFDFILTSENDFGITGHNALGQLFIQKTDNQGNTLWRQDYDTPNVQMKGEGITEDYENHLVVAGERVDEITTEIDPFLAKITANGTPLWERNMGKTGLEDGFHDIQITPKGDYLMGGYRQITYALGHHGTLYIKSDTFGIVKGGHIFGNVFHDTDVDCLPALDELKLEDWVVRVTGDTSTYFGNVDALGNYTVPVDVLFGETLDFIVSINPPSNYWEACENEIPITLSYLDTMQVDFPMQGIVECPFMQTYIVNSTYRVCDSATVYVTYCNYGTALADSATLEVNLGEYLYYQNATVQPSSVDGGLINFDLGVVDINECETIILSVLTDCDSIAIDSVLCIETYITPDIICEVPGQVWSGALLEGNFTCDDDEIQFNLKNTGNSPMAAQQDYIIIEDAVLLFQGSFDLNPNESILPEVLQKDGSTYFLIAPQEPDAPGPEWITLGANDCPNGTHSTLNQLQQNNGSPFSTIFCSLVYGPFDPNDKIAFPTGYGDNHNILPNTDLQYKIRFQNVGTDTAFRVVIRDTLSQHLDPSTLIPGASSHPYEWRLNGNGELIFTFHNINLPDSTANWAASQGFVSYKIAQQKDLPEETRIENRAGIYFDFNDPIITNTTFHTVKLWLEIIDKTVSVATPELTVTIAPNPMQRGAWIQMEGMENTNGVLELNLFDLSGKKITTTFGMGNKIWLERNNLTSGMYFFNITQDGEWQASGKIVVD